MKVKRLEIQGFKSFKDKTVLHFDEGVTGIVGPNGCGKSNIVDSFFWVMGEQSIKHMRADGQLDLIFNGSEKYAPLNIAEVTLVLSTGATGEGLPDGASVRDLPAHLKFSEISITRRLHRDSTSEYLINGEPCRLKDIHELFMDTGAGPKAYSIIEQGQIARIIQAKSEDRRVLIEEAAGIVKFKARKKESLRKIEATQVNLSRINDIIIEIERQLNTLERQAQKARQYKEFKEELLHKEMLVGRKKLFGLKEKIQFADSEVNTLQVTEIESRGNLQTAELRIENFKIQLAEVQRLVEDKQVHFQELQREISQEDTKLQIQKRKIQEIENSNVSLEDETQELINLIQNYQEEIVKFESEETELQGRFQLAEQNLAEKQNSIEESRDKVEESGRQLDAQKRELMAILSHQKQISNQVHGDEARIDSLSSQISNLDLKIKDREIEFGSLNQNFEEAKYQFETTSAQSQSQRIRSENLKTEVAQLETKLQSFRKDESIVREELAKTESKFKAIQEFVNSHEGFKMDVRNILEDAELSVGLNGVLADFITAQPGYEFALQAVLRDFLENLIVDDTARAQEVLSSLKNKNKGRAAFWSVEMIEKAAQHIQKFDQNLVKAIMPSAKSICEVLDIRHAHASSLNTIFDRFFIVESLEDALFSAEKTLGMGISFVSKDGDFVDRFGRIIGGSTKSLEGGILSRKTELQILDQSLISLQIKSLELHESVKSTETQLLDKREEHDRNNTELKTLELQVKHFERDLASLDSRVHLLRNELEKNNTEFSRLENERIEIRARLDQIRSELSALDLSTSDHEASIEQLNQDSILAQAQLDQVQSECTQFKIEASSTGEKLRYVKQNLDRIRFDLKQDLIRKEEVERMMNRKLDEKDMLAQELIVIESTVIELNEQAQELESHLRLQKNEFEKCNMQLTASFDDQRIFMKKLEEAASSLNRLKLDHERWLIEYQMLYQSMFQKYGLEEIQIAPQNDAEKATFDELNSEREFELQQEVDRLHERIRKLGEVNVLAVEEYDEQKKRFDFLTAQREDLLRSIADLEKAIERINKTSEERFKIAFDEINIRFEKIFPIVFGGGWGKLEMTNPADLNETGIDIIAEPPGKKVSSIQLMSGGEKALTAVALIFSIFLIKPSPFCVLDEVDAPLDDHNVGKFNALLKEMATRSQFIIITHNKRTMELNDKLYGVTMEEPGVSKMVSIQLQ